MLCEGTNDAQKTSKQTQLEHSAIAMDTTNIDRSPGYKGIKRLNFKLLRLTRSDLKLMLITKHNP